MFILNIILSISKVLYDFKTCALSSGVNGVSANMPRVILVATHADAAQTPRDHGGHYVSDQADSVCATLSHHYATTFHINRRVVVLDSHQALSPGVRLLKTLIQAERTSIAQVLTLFIVCCFFFK